MEHLRGVPVLPRGRVAATPKLDAEAGDGLVSADTGDEVRVPSGKSSAARTSAAVGGAVEPYICMSGWPSVVPMSPMPEFTVLDDDWEARPDDVPDAMPAGPSGPAQPGVMTAVVAAITAAGTATSAAARATAPRRATGRSARDGRHSSAAHPMIRPNSRTQLTTSSAPTDSAWCKSGPNGRPTVRDATYTAITMAFPARPSHSHSRDGRQSRTARPEGTAGP